MLAKVLGEPSHETLGHEAKALPLFSGKSLVHLSGKSGPANKARVCRHADSAPGGAPHRNICPCIADIVKAGLPECFNQSAGFLLRLEIQSAVARKRAGKKPETLANSLRISGVSCGDQIDRSTGGRFGSQPANQRFAPGKRIDAYCRFRRNCLLEGGASTAQGREHPEQRKGLAPQEELDSFPEDIGVDQCAIKVHTKWNDAFPREPVRHQLGFGFG